VVRFIAILAALAAAAQHATPKGRKADAADSFFSKSPICELRLEVGAAELEALRKEPRQFVKCVLREGGGARFEGVSVKLKGAAGSFRELDDKPAFTLRMDKVKKDQRFHGLAKLHLNNSVQDETYLHELIAAELFKEAGIPAARVAHARVKLNDRDLGFYVLKEGFDEHFLARHFLDPRGNLYDGGFCQDIDADLERDEGDGGESRGDLKGLLGVAQVADSKARSVQLAQRLDVPEFVTFMAMEEMLGHWDGYTINRNNYRLYFDQRSGKSYFIPHGMDQVLGDPEASILDPPTALVASAVQRVAAWRTLYRKRLKELLPLFSPPDKLLALVKESSARLRPVLAAGNSEAGVAYDERIADLRRRIEERARNLRDQCAAPEPKPISFAGSSIYRPKMWRSASESEDAKLTEARVGGEKLLMIECGPSGSCVASFRATALLERGRYRFMASVKTEGVAPLPGEEAPQSGAAARISGEEARERVQATTPWRSLNVDFEVADDARPVELVVELRASKGRASFKVDSLKLQRLGA